MINPLAIIREKGRSNDAALWSRPHDFVAQLLGAIGVAGVPLAALTVLAVALRLAAVVAVGSYRLEHVSYEHGEIARNLVEGRGFSVRWMGAEGPTSQEAPLYPLLVAAFYGSFGIQTPAALLGLQLFQALLGGVLVICVVGLAGEIDPERPVVGWLAGAAAALDPTLIYMTTQVQVVSLATLGLVAVLWIAYRAARGAATPAALACGAVTALAVLADPILSLVGLVAVARIAAGRGRISSASLARAAAAAVVCCALVLPWLLRNYAVHGELVPIKSTFGYAFWQGNHPRSFGTDKIPLPAADATLSRATTGPRDLERTLWHARMIDTLYIDDAVLSNDRIAQLGHFSEPERSRRLMAEVVAYLHEHPGHYLRLCFQRLRYFLLFDETNPKSRVLGYRVPHLALLVLSTLGLWHSRRWACRLWPTYLVFGLVTAFHTLTIVSARFQIPLEPVQILWATLGAADYFSSDLRLAPGIKG